MRTRRSLALIHARLAINHQPQPPIAKNTFYPRAQMTNRPTDYSLALTDWLYAGAKWVRVNDLHWRAFVCAFDVCNWQSINQKSERERMRETKYITAAAVRCLIVDNKYANTPQKFSLQLLFFWWRLTHGRLTPQILPNDYEQNLFHKYSKWE